MPPAAAPPVLPGAAPAVDLAPGHPAAGAGPLAQAAEDGRRAAAVGLDWPDAAGVLDKIAEELAELRVAVAGGDPADITHELGDLLLSAVSLGRHTGVSAENALETANLRFRRRFAAVVARAEAGGVPLGARPPEERERLWADVKAMESR